ncbi:MAG: FG-GAP-like repeat-containing protein [Nocardioides sp.]
MRENKSRFVVVCQQLLAVGAVVAMAAPAAGVVTLDIVGQHPAVAPRADSAADAGSLVASAPVKPVVHEVTVGGVDPRGLAALSAPGGTEASGDGLRLSAADTGTGDTLPDGSGDLAALTAPEPVDGLGTVGVTWKHGVQVSDGDIAVSVRTKTDGVWSQWQPVPYHDDHGPDPDSAEGRKARPGTDPVYLGQVDDVQMKAVTATGDVPAGMELAVVDPGQEQAPTVEKPAIDTGKLTSAATGTAPTAGVDATLSDATTSPSPSPSASPTDGTTSSATTTSTDGTATAQLAGTPGDVTPKPQIFSRAQWGADERMRDPSSLHYNEVHAGFVHHTVNANGYTRDQVPAIIRGIYAYHTQSKGWSDIGYNFLVDRFGRIWEGRYGGVDRPVVGAHTLGYNDYAFAMSAIGNYDIYDGGRGIPSQAMLDAYGRLFAWKLSLHGVNAGSLKQWVGKRYLAAINGHRDTGEATACPGRYLYAKLPTIRALAAADQHAWTERGRRTDLAGSSWPDLIVRDRTTRQAYVVQTGGQVGFAAARTLATGWSDKDLVAGVGDLNGDGKADVMARDKTTKNTSVFPGDAAGHLGASIADSSRFTGLDMITGVGDLSGDGRNDIVGREASTHRLYLYPGKGNGRFGTARLLSGSWGAFDLTSGVGDLTGDGRPDLVARAGNVLSLYPGTSTGRLAAPVRLPGSWGGYNVVAGMGDLTNDGKADLVARAASTGATYLYPGDGAGHLGARYGAFTSMSGVKFLGSAGSLAGSRAGDLMGVDSSGRLRVFTNNGEQNVVRTVPVGRGFTKANLVLNVGDWNGDGHGDVVTRAADGTMYFYAGDGQGHFPKAIGMATGFGDVRLLTAVGDMTGDGYPDLMGQPSGGSMRIYPGNGATGFKRSYVAHAALDATLQIGIGRWDGDGSPDTFARRSDGTLALYPGNGPGGLTGSGSTAVATGTRGYDWMSGVGDADGDGRPDIIAREASTGSLWLLPGTSHGLGPRRLVGTGFGKYDLGS